MTTNLPPSLESRRARDLLDWRHSLVRWLLVGVWFVGVLLVVGGGPAAFGSGGGVTVYVDAGSGSDGRSLVEAQNSGTPWKTVDHAVGQVPAGSTVVALSGSFDLNAGGLSFDPGVVIKGGPGTSIVATFDGSRGFTLTGFFFPEYTEISGSSSIVITSGESVGGFGIGSGSSYVTLSGMYIHNVDDPSGAPWEKAVALGRSGEASNITISGNRFSNNPEDSIQIGFARNVAITSNYFTNNGPWNAVTNLDYERHSDVIQILGGENITIVDNTLIGNAHVLMFGEYAGHVIDNIVVRGNRFDENRGYAVNIRGISGSVTLDSNTYLCNGVYWTETCTDPDRYDALVQDVPNFTRINDPDVPFVDIDGNIHEANIYRLAAAGITKGCNPPTNDKYCPTNAVTRGQMAAFLNRAFKFPASEVDYFTDDNGTTFEADINAIAKAGITNGCNPPANDHFCPSGQVNRGQMAAFLNRTFHYPAATIDYFVDDNGSIFEADINAIAEAGITNGCNPPFENQYCAADLVKRDQMASFLARA